MVTAANIEVNFLILFFFHVDFMKNKPAALEGQPEMLRKIRRLIRTYNGIKFAKSSDTCFLKIRNFDREMA